MPWPSLRACSISISCMTQALSSQLLHITESDIAGSRVIVVRHCKQLRGLHVNVAQSQDVIQCTTRGRTISRTAQGRSEGS